MTGLLADGEGLLRGMGRHCCQRRRRSAMGRVRKPDRGGAEVRLCAGFRTPA
jgi:hypothetical protein